MVETTEVMNVQITFIKNEDCSYDRAWDLEKWIKNRLQADDVKITNLRRFEMEKEEANE